MKKENGSTTRGELGGGLVEFCFTIPVLLLIAGATIDLSRYMRFLQVTTFVSQETAGQIYRQCSDITIYNPPQLKSSTLSIDTAKTETAVRACIERVQGGAQQLLNSSLGRAAVSSTVFRWNIGDPTITASCAGVSSTIGSVTVITAPASLTNSGVSSTTQVKIDDEDCDEEDDDDDDDLNPSSSNGSSIYSAPNTTPDTESRNNLPAGLTVSGIALRTDGIYQTKNGSSATPRRLVSTSTLCERGRVATVEVSYAFEPVVKFLPHMMIKLNTDGSQRETTVL
jgi:Flp pilus assembly protein TadG